jgi:hypothetical protein
MNPLEVIESVNITSYTTVVISKGGFCAENSERIVRVPTRVALCQPPYELHPQDSSSNSSST